MTINAAAAVATQNVQSQIGMAVLAKVSQQVRLQQEQTLSLVDAALESAEAINSGEAGVGAVVDTRA